MTVTLHAGERRTLEALAANVAQGKQRAREQAGELVPLLCDVPDALRLFDALAVAVRDGQAERVAGLLDKLVGA